MQYYLHYWTSNTVYCFITQNDNFHYPFLVPSSNFMSHGYVIVGWWIFFFWLVLDFWNVIIGHNFSFWMLCVYCREGRWQSWYHALFAIGQLKGVLCIAVAVRALLIAVGKPVPSLPWILSVMVAVVSSNQSNSRICSKVIVFQQSLYLQVFFSGLHCFLNYPQGKAVRLAIGNNPTSPHVGMSCWAPWTDCLADIGILGWTVT